MVHSGPAQDGIAGEKIKAAFLSDKNQTFFVLIKDGVRGIIISKRIFF
jgi:hypothetical protein